MIYLTIVFISFSAKSETISLLDLPLSDGSLYSYNVSLKNKCSFKDIVEISQTETSNITRNISFTTKINLFQRKINLAIDNARYSEEVIVFNLAGAKNIFFMISMNKNCETKRKLKFDNVIYELENIKIEYNDFLNTPVVKKIILNDQNQAQDLTLFPSSLQGLISSYELKIGLGINTHTNNRTTNRNPTIEIIPAFLFRYATFFINKDGAGSLVYHAGDFNVLLLGILEGEPYKSDAIIERKKQFFIGGILKYENYELIFYNDYFKHHGYNLKLTANPEFYINSFWKYSPQIYIQLWDEKYVDYYFGNSENKNLNAYKGKATFNHGIMLEVTHYVKDWTYVIDLGFKKYSSEVSRSPTVKRNLEFRFITSFLFNVF